MNFVILKYVLVIAMIYKYMKYKLQLKIVDQKNVNAGERNMRHPVEIKVPNIPTTVKST